MRSLTEKNKDILIAIKTMNWVANEGLIGYVIINYLDFGTCADIVKILESFGGRWLSINEAFIFEFDIRKDIEEFLNELDKRVNIDLVSRAQSRNKKLKELR